MTHLIRSTSLNNAALANITTGWAPDIASNCIANNTINLGPEFNNAVMAKITPESATDIDLTNIASNTINLSNNAVATDIAPKFDATPSVLEQWRHQFNRSREFGRLTTVSRFISRCRGGDGESGYDACWRPGFGWGVQ